MIYPSFIKIIFCQSSKNKTSNKQLKKNKKNLKILVILNWYKYILDNLTNSLNNTSNIKLLAILKQINILSNDIPDLKNSANNFKERRYILKSGL